MKHGGFFKPHCWHNVTGRSEGHFMRTHCLVPSHNGLSERAVCDEKCCECGTERTRRYSFGY